MKKIVLGLIGVLALTACGGNSDSGSSNDGSYSGNYSGTLIYQGSTLGNFSAHITQSNNPNNGDVVGTMSASNGGSATIAGNIESGKLTMTDPPNAYNAGVAKCNGKWTNGNRYDGVCDITTANSGLYNVTVALTKR